MKVKYMKEVKPNDFFSIKWRIWVNDDYFEIASEGWMTIEEIAEFLECEEEEIVQIDLEDFE